MFFFLTATLYRCIIIAFGVLYPAFSSYKSLNKRDGYEQVKWMMYWIVFAVFTACEVVTDLLFCWLPLYYETKIAFVLWLVLPITRGSSYLYRKIIHPNLLKHETEIDRYIAKASNKGCEVLIEFGQHGMNFAASAVLRTADHLKRSYSVGDVSTAGPQSVLASGTLDEDFNSRNYQVGLVPMPICDRPSTSNSNSNREKPKTTRIKRSTKVSRQVVAENQPKEPENFLASDGEVLQVQVARRLKKNLHKLDEE